MIKNVSKCLIFLIFSVNTTIMLAQLFSVNIIHTNSNHLMAWTLIRIKKFPLFSCNNHMETHQCVFFQKKKQFLFYLFVIQSNHVTFSFHSNRLIIKVELITFNRIKICIIWNHGNHLRPMFPAVEAKRQNIFGHSAVDSCNSTRNM